MPAYNEAENIEATIRQWYPIVDKLSQEGVDAKLFIANDGSKDNTFAIMKGLKDRKHLLKGRCARCRATTALPAAMALMAAHRPANILPIKKHTPQIILANNFCRRKFLLNMLLMRGRITTGKHKPCGRISA